MQLTLTLVTGTGRRDVAVEVEQGTTVGDVARALSPGEGRAKPTLSVETSSGQARLDPEVPVLLALGCGAVVTVADSTSTEVISAYSMRILEPDGGSRTVPLSRGANAVGRWVQCDLLLEDPTVSALHSTLLVGDGVTVIDEHSTNGTVLNGLPVPRATLEVGDELLLGDTTLRLEGSAPVSGRSEDIGPIAFNRSPRVEAAYPGVKFRAPSVPDPIRPQRLPYITALLPLLMGAVMFATTRHLASLLFVVMSPLMAVGAFLQGKVTAKADFDLAVKNFHALLAALVDDVRAEQATERSARVAETPALSDLMTAAAERSSLLWCRRPDSARFLSLRLGVGTDLSRSTVEMPGRADGVADLRRLLLDTVAPLSDITDVPVACSLTQSGPLGISGAAVTRDRVARALIAQLTAIHAPGEVSLAVLAPPARTQAWEWLKWLPHVNHERHPLTGRALAGTTGAVMSVVDDLLAVVASRSPKDDVPLPRLVLLVDDDSPGRRSDLVQLAEQGGPVGVHVIWLSATLEALPAACKTFLDCGGPDGARIGRVIEGSSISPVILETLEAPEAEAYARLLAPLEDANLPSEAQHDVPTVVSFLGELGADLGSDPNGVVRRWRESGSLPGDGRPARRNPSLRAFVGRGSQDAVYLDLKSQGPHALVGGTTGAGKSEFLQTWILGMATAHSPRSVNFLFVDYKGGSAFAECVDLPHSVGLVTDLSPHLVQRALVSLKAELRYREHIMNAKGAKDLAELERRGDPDAPPSLVIVVDEFAALVQEVPEFVDGMVSIAQLGRSLGLHLILATQRPAGVIRGNLRANTNLRVALRMADAEDSNDVIGDKIAATFAVDTPGRAVAKAGPGRPTLMQAAYVGGRTAAEGHEPNVRVMDFGFGLGQMWQAPAVEGDDAASEMDDRTDSARVVDTLRAAAESLLMPEPRRPWLPELARAYDLAQLVDAGGAGPMLVFAMADDPDRQVQRPVGFRPDVDGSMAVFGTGGSGKSTVLRSLAVAAALSVRLGSCHVYGIDFGSRGLAMLEGLPHVGAVISGDDSERIIRLFRRLRTSLDDRAVRYSEVNAGNIEDFRASTGKADEPRILLLLDGYGAFRNAYETGPENWVFDTFTTLVAGGRSLGIHVVFTADRPTAVPGALQSVVQQRLFLRLASENDIMAAGRAIPKGGFDDETPPGRGYLNELEVQVGTPAAADDAATQAPALAALAATLRAEGGSAAPAVERLPEHVPLSTLPVAASPSIVVGIRDEDLGPFAIDATGLFIIAGPAGSGRRTTVLTIVEAMRASGCSGTFVYFGSRRSYLSAHPGWTVAETEASEIATRAQEIAVAVARDPSMRALVVIDAVGELVNSAADSSLQELARACRGSHTMLVAVGEASDLAGSWPLLQVLRADRRGLLLQPDAPDGESVLRTALPRVNRRDFPAGRGMYVAAGRASRVQIAVSGEG